MRTRVLVHYLDGTTFKGKWNGLCDFDELKVKPISSLQIQSNKQIYTLSAKRKQAGKFHICDVLGYNNEILQRVMYKEIHNKIVLIFEVDCKTGNRRILLMESKCQMLK